MRLLEGRSGIVPLRGFDTAGCRSTLAAEIAGFDAAAWVPPMKVRRMDRTGVYAVAATKLALEDAGASISAEGDDALGVVLGTWTAGGGSTQQFLDALFRKGPSGAPALLFDSTVANAAASLAGLEHRFRGPNVTVSHKEASGLAAVVSAVDLIREGRATALMTGGVDAIFETFYKAHDRFEVMSPEAAFFAAARAVRHRAERLRARRRRVRPVDRATPRPTAIARPCTARFWASPPRAPPARSTRGRSAGAARPHDAARARGRRAGAGRGRRGLCVGERDARASTRSKPLALSELFGETRTVVTSIKGALGEFGASGGAACAAALLCGRIGRVPPIAGLTCAGSGGGVAAAGADRGRRARTDRARQQLRERRRAVQRRAPGRAQCERADSRECMMPTLDRTSGHGDADRVE